MAGAFSGTRGWGQPARGVPGPWAAPCAARKEDVQLCSSHQLSAGVCQRRGVCRSRPDVHTHTHVHTHAHMFTCTHTSLTHTSLSCHAEPVCQGRRCPATPTSHWQLQEFGSWWQAFARDSHQRKGGGGGGDDVSEASALRGRARKLSPCTALLCSDGGC